MTGYVELQVTSNFSFLRGASHPSELVRRAAGMGHEAIAIADRNTLAGVVRAHQAAQAVGLKLVIGCRLDLEDAGSLLCFPMDRAAYGRLARLLTRGKRRAAKGECRIGYGDVVEHGEGQLVVALPPERLDPAAREALAGELARLAADFPGRAYLAAQHLYRGDDGRRLHRLARLAAAAGLPLVATNDVLYHVPERRMLQDVVTCIREGCTIATAGLRLAAHAERHLKPAAEMARLFRAYPEAVAESCALARRCRFSLDELRYEYPDEVAPNGLPPQQELERLTAAGALRRYPPESHPAGVPEKVTRQIEHELRLVGALGYAPYFLTVHDIVRFARARGILCQGRGSAANSAVCYCLGITEVDPNRLDVLFERFISAERDEPPDIDVDFEHERREEVIQYLYGKYGRDRAGLAATVIHYRARRAIREVGKVMGLSEDVVGALAGTVWGWSSDGLEERHVRELGLDPADRNLRLALDLAGALIGFPRHLSQHVGGFVITRGPLEELVPIENAAMAERTVIEWDKDDLDALGILKVDVLALGMLSCIRRAFDLIARHHGALWTLATVPAEVRGVYDMLCRADSIGVFQVESRAQMSMLPRLKPREFYDLVIEVAIVRPGPIQGDMVHPYLRRRDGKERVAYPSEALRQVLEKTLGVPLFQEQAMRIAIVAAGFTPAEADQLRRAMATFRHSGEIHRFRDKFITGMVENGYDSGFAERCFQQIQGFGEYGFPESHAASFALLVYVSAWLKWRHPEVFAAALLNSQPMGFYAPAQIVRDARDHGVEVRPVDVNFSQWDCTLEPAGEAEPGRSGDPGGSGGERRYALRLGLRQVKGCAAAEAERLVAGRGTGYGMMAELMRRGGVGRATLEGLAHADAFRSLGLDRRQALWAVKGLQAETLPLFAPLAPPAAVAPPAAPPPAAPPPAASPPEPLVALPAMRLGEHVVQDYASLGLSLKQHPLALLRHRLERRGAVPAAALATRPPERRVTVAGLVLVRQRPGSAQGVIFVTLEDESGVANLVVWPPVFERFRRVVMGARLIACTGRLQREGIVIHVVAERLEDLSAELARLTRPEEAPSTAPRPGAAALAIRSRDFH